jgi:hypothetical protein
MFLGKIKRETKIIAPKIDRNSPKFFNALKNNSYQSLSRLTIHQLHTRVEDQT